MRTNTGDAISKILRQHHGRANAISAPDICLALGWPISRERLVRRVIADENALWPDVLICAIPGEGYFCAARFEEIVAYDNWLAHLATDAADKFAAFRAAARRLGFCLDPQPAAPAELVSA